MNKALLYNIAITQIKGVGLSLSKKLIQLLGCSEAIFSESKSALLKISYVNDSIASSIVDGKAIALAQNEMNFITKHNITASYIDDENYPYRLKQCEDAPLILFSKGKHNLGAQKVVSVIGTRKSTEYGHEVCSEILRDLSCKYPDLLVVSGLAYGIDVHAHTDALRNNLPTAAVLAHGLDRIYPTAHARLATNIIDNGALVSEFISGSSPERHNFVKRNRIIAGISDATLVIESAHKGGALITAKLAQSYNRDVLAVPGSVNSQSSKGTNMLIKSNIAALVESASDIEYALGWEKSSNPEPIQQSIFNQKLTPPGDKGVIYNILNSEGELSLNTLSLKSEFDIPKLSNLLLQMEFDNLVKSLPGNIFKLNRF